jgi:hypothetical protein
MSNTGTATDNIHLFITLFLLIAAIALRQLAGIPRVSHLCVLAEIIQAGRMPCFCFVLCVGISLCCKYLCAYLISRRDRYSAARAAGAAAGRSRRQSGQSRLGRNGLLMRISLLHRPVYELNNTVSEGCFGEVPREQDAAGFRRRQSGHLRIGREGVLSGN